MHYHDPEHLKRFKQDLIEAVNRVSFDQSADQPTEAIEVLLGKLLEVATGAKDLCAHVAYEIDQHDSQIKAESEVSEHFEETINFIKHNIEFDIERRQSHFLQAAE